MEIIQSPVGGVLKAWGEQPCKPVDYRLMKYLLRKEIDAGTLLCNVVTGELLLLSVNEATHLDKLPCAYTPEMDELIRHRFLVPIDFDEHKSVQQLRKIMALLRKKKEITTYTILPTTHCNARCFYCYEADMKHINMSEQTAHKTVRFIREHCGDKQVKLNWFGGEPTVGAARIDQICSGLSEEDIKFTSGMVSNGYLLDETMCEKAKNLWKLDFVQITLDGTEEVYNRVKSYRTVTGSPYRTVMNNIRFLLDREIRVSVRMNMDRYNFEDLEALIAELTERFSGSKYFSAYVHSLFDDCGYVRYKHSDDDKVWLEQQTNRLNELIRMNTNSSEKRGGILGLKSNYCMADNDSSVIINPDGTLAKCEHVLDDIVGTLDEGLTDQNTLSAWKVLAEYPQCAECPVYPFCTMLKDCFSNTTCSELNQRMKLDSAERRLLAVYEAKFQPKM